jgi:hypothetical protein
MQKIRFLVFFVVLSLTGSAHAAVKFYDSSEENGLPADFINSSGLCPPVQTSLGILQGHTQLVDDGLGTVTMSQFQVEITTFIDLGPEVLTMVFGPGSFIFIDALTTDTIDVAGTSNTSGVGGHGPSGTAPGETTEWGILTGFQSTGTQFCLSSPVSVCNDAGFAHGSTVGPTLTSNSFDLGTWNFDALGNYSTDSPFINRTASGGTTNTQFDMRGAFVGASLPALPLVGFVVLALSLAVIGGRALLGRK